MKGNTILIIILCVFITACTEEYDLQLNGEPKLVINMTITNTKPPYYIQMIKSKSCYEPLYDYVDYEHQTNYEVVHDATVIITDNIGVIDTLVHCPDSVWEYYNDGDSSLVYNFYAEYFSTSKIEGIPGHTYNLRVEWQGNVYTSECTMPKAVEIDSVTIYRHADKFEDHAAGYVPYLWFHDDPTTENYYVFENAIYGASVWGINIMSDEQLNTDDICGIDAFSGEAPDGATRNTIFAGTHTSKEWGYDKVCLYSVTKEVYEYYSSLIKQIRYDGGVYTPSPASAPTNIKGGALGLFNAASVDWRFFY